MGAHELFWQTKIVHMFKEVQTRVSSAIWALRQLQSHLMMRALRSTTERDSGGRAIVSATAHARRSIQESIELALEKNTGEVVRGGSVANSLKQNSEIKFNFLMSG